MPGFFLSGGNANTPEYDELSALRKPERKLLCRQAVASHFMFQHVESSVSRLPED